MPKGGLKMSANANKSLNCYSHHAPKMDWFIQFFNFKDTFDQNHSLGSQMYSFFKRFLRDAELLDETGYSNFASVVNQLGLDNLSSWALMLTNLAYTPQINWLVKRVETHENMIFPPSRLGLLEGSFNLEWQHPHIFLGLCRKGGRLGIVCSIPRFHPGEKMVCDYVACVVGQFGTSAFQMSEVVTDVIVGLLKGY